MKIGTKMSKKTLIPEINEGLRRTTNGYFLCV
jgi:hypothetical protein